MIQVVRRRRAFRVLALLMWPAMFVDGVLFAVAVGAGLAESPDKALTNALATLAFAALLIVAVVASRMIQDGRRFGTWLALGWAPAQAVAVVALRTAVATVGGDQFASAIDVALWVSAASALASMPAAVRLLARPTPVDR